MTYLHQHRAIVGGGATKGPRRLRSHGEDAQILGGSCAPEERGGTLTEFAFILPVLCMCLFGVIDFGRALYSYHFVSDAAREASRWASVRGSTCADYADACPASDSQISDYVLSIVPSGIDKTRGALSVSSNFVQPAGVANSCTAPSNKPGCAVHVTVSYNFKFIFPFLPSSTLGMHSTSEMVISK
jgi:Flp pilus assembly protein TadG